MAKKVMPSLHQLIQYFDAVNGKSQYSRYVRNIDKINGQQTVCWIFDVINSKGTLDDVLRKYDSFMQAFSNNKLSNKTIGNYRSGLKKFSQVVLGFYSANTWLNREKGKKIDFQLCKLIADNALFASKDVVDEVINGILGTDDNRAMKGNNYASWDYMLHIRNTKQKKGTRINDTSIANIYPNATKYVVADDNTCANHYIKQAIICSFNKKFGGLMLSSWNKFIDYSACHVWDMPGDRRYYASIANLILLPKSLADITDHNDTVKELLRYEVYKRFGFKPAGVPTPTIPNRYNQIKWRYSF